MCENVKLDAHEHDISTAMDALNLLIIQDHLQATMVPESQTDFSQQMATLRLAAANLARKQNNMGLAERLLVQEIIGSVGIEPETDIPNTVESAMAVLSDVQCTSGVKNSAHIIKLEREGAKLTHSKGQHRDGIEAMVLSILRHANVVSLKPSQHRELIKVGGELNARSLVTLVQWMQSDHKYVNHSYTIYATSDYNGLEYFPMYTFCANYMYLQISEPNECSNKVTRTRRRHFSRGCTKSEIPLRFGRGSGNRWQRNSCGREWGPRYIITHLPFTQCIKFTMLLYSSCISCFVAIGVRIGDNPILADSDALVGRLLHLATIQSPNLAKAWFSLAGWCNKWGRKAVDNAV